MSKLEICISTAFDYRRMQKPKALEKQLADLNPSANSKTLLWDWALPLREWRLEKAEKIKKDFNRLTRLLLDDKTVRIFLLHSSPLSRLEQALLTLRCA